MKRKGYKYIFEYFTENTIEGVKKQYKQLVKANHPDVHPATEYTHYNSLMGAINEEYDFIINHWFAYTPAKHSANTANTAKAAAQDTKKTAAQAANISDEMQSVLNKINSIDGIRINIVGSWLWVDGNTRPVKEQLKAAGLKWHSKKTMWFWAPSDSKRKGYRGNTTFDENCEKYGCTTYSSKGTDKIA